MSISGGKIVIEDGIKKAEEYAPPRKVLVELRFEVPEGSDYQPLLDLASQTANARVAALLGKAAPVAAPVVLQVNAQAVATPEPTKETAAAKKARLAAEKAAVEGTGKTKADLAKEAGLPTTDIVHKGPQTATGGLVEEDETPAAASEAASEDELGDLMGEAAPTPISDQELGRMAQDKMAKLKASQGDKFSPVAIRELINKFSGNKRIADVPSEKRHEFKAALEALK